MSVPEIETSIHSHLVELGISPKLDAAVILGSGLGDFGDQIQNSTIIPYADIPGFPQSTVAGHSGALIVGEVSGKTVMAFSGRFHFYEGYPFSTTIIPVQLSAAFHVDKLIISNAAGGINLDFRVGDLMVINNVMHPHIEITIPEIDGWVDELNSTSKSVELIAGKIGVTVKNGTYLYVTGPNYETKAEIRAFRDLGGDAVGMSTAVELMEAYNLGLKAVAISLITNAAAGVTDQKLDHTEVKEAAEMKKEEFAKLVIGLIETL
jgi:purine-nucleoside phosphorylase